MRIKSLPLSSGPFGKREFGGMHWHCGIALMADEGPPVLAASGGTVAKSL